MVCKASKTSCAFPKLIKCKIYAYFSLNLAILDTNICIYVQGSAKMFWPNTSGYIVGTYIISDRVERQSQDEKKHFVTKDVVGLLLGDLVSTNKHTSLQRMWLACYLER